MIQRKQTLFLLAGAICALLTFLFPAARYQVVPGGEQFTYTTTGVFNAVNVPLTDLELKFPLGTLSGLVAVVLVAGIFFYGNRKRQLVIVRASYLLILVAQYLLFSQHLSLASYLEKGRKLETHFGIAMFLPIVVLLFAFLAERGIRKDEELVKSMDRLR